ncbi:MAG: hypothetical protein A3F40_01485 [Chlamydiae bacterium RIFCSPHIGHO2_12_FULL_27_8]|nr:MAG: hypothetical protein A3F40_01485 [Chlamydiae bacterium RIFCSPHIGHO2_12_FULL_27_8]OGN64945.1 MAG: hypothetical protein A2888_01875 [Chlamydiae bacterium RIFCSPLOWO2_01_FULL_28_7]
MKILFDDKHPLGKLYFEKKDGEDNFFITEVDETVKKINQVFSDFVFRDIKESVIIQMLRDREVCQIELNKIDDEDDEYELHINEIKTVVPRRNLNMSEDKYRLLVELKIHDKDVKDEDISASLVKHLAKTKTYTSVYVTSSESCKFHTVVKPGRIIRTTIDALPALRNTFSIIFTKVYWQSQPEDENKLELAVLGSDVSSNVDELQRSYLKNYTLEIHASYDLQSCILMPVEKPKCVIT